MVLGMVLGMGIIAPVIIIVWGVAGSGKTTIGKALAVGMSCPYFDADHFHPAANIKKMASGQPLTDVDRLPWLKQLREIVDNEELQPEDDALVYQISALKEALLVAKSRLEMVRQARRSAQLRVQPHQHRPTARQSHTR